MPRLSDASRQRRRETIAAAAMRCFARNGFAATSMADIVSEANSSAGSVYSNFASKAELVRFAASGVLNDLFVALSEQLPPDPTPTSVLACLMKSSTDKAHAQTVLQIWAEVPHDSDIAAIVRESLVNLRVLIQTALLPWCKIGAHPEVAPSVSAVDALADVVMTALQGYLVRISIDREVDADLLAARMIALFALLVPGT